MNKNEKQQYIENYFNWLNYECSDPFGEIEFLINLALNSNDKQKMTDALKETFKHYNNK